MFYHNCSVKRPSSAAMHIWPLLSAGGAKYRGKCCQFFFQMLTREVGLARGLKDQPEPVRIAFKDT
jgi:hypothetical protein